MTAFIRSGLPRDWPSCLEKPGAGRCGKWFFWLCSRIAQPLDRLASPCSLPTRARARQLFRTERGIQGKQARQSPAQLPALTPQGPVGPGAARGKGAPGTGAPRLLPRWLWFLQLPSPPRHLTHPDCGAAALHPFPLSLCLPPPPASSFPQSSR